jgi:hypothetical protein
VGWGLGVRMLTASAAALLWRRSGPARQPTPLPPPLRLLLPPRPSWRLRAKYSLFHVNRVHTGRFPRSFG